MYTRKRIAHTCYMRQLDGDHYVLNGTKNWITNGPQADSKNICTSFSSFNRVWLSMYVCEFVASIYQHLSQGESKNMCTELCCFIACDCLYTLLGWLHSSICIDRVRSYAHYLAVSSHVTVSTLCFVCCTALFV
jgi:hypothetical protein